MAKTETKKTKEKSTSGKKVTKKADLADSKVEKKDTQPGYIVLNALNNKYPMWTNGLALETDLLSAIHPVHLRDVLDFLVNENMVAFDRANFAYQITENGKIYLDNVKI